VWRRLIEAGRPDGLVPAGLGARDTLRLEARMMLYGNDIDETTSLIEAGLGWIVSLDPGKGDFNGRGILAEQKAKGAPRRLVGFELVGRGIARHGYPVFQDGEPRGAVTSGTFAPFLQKSIGLCYLPAARATAGAEIEVGIRGSRVAARVVPTPFYKRPRN
jgi:aminomethyltransferase